MPVWSVFDRQVQRKHPFFKRGQSEYLFEFNLSLRWLALAGAVDLGTARPRGD
jgi:hypothetical protein